MENTQKRIEELEKEAERRKSRWDALCSTCDRLRDENDSLLEKVQGLEKEVGHWKERLKTETNLRPVWAQGYSSDSIAAQVSSTALKTLWDKLGVDNQTAAVNKITEGQRAIEALEKIEKLVSDQLWEDGYYEEFHKSILSILADWREV